jgi:hypothetical protein
MRKITLFVATVTVVDAWLSITTLAPGALAGSTFNRLSVTTVAKASPISRYHYDEYLLVTD